MARKNLVYINNDILKLVIILSVCKISDFIIWCALFGENEKCLIKPNQTSRIV